MHPGRPAGHRAGHRVFEVLAVCTANLCRSPAMEAQLRADLALLPGSWSVHSAGTQGRPGLPVHPLTARALAERDLAVPEGWLSRRLTDDDVGRADLVLTATRAHRSDVVARVPQAARYVFTLRQFARLLDAAPGRATQPDDGHPGHALLRTAISARGLAVPERPEDDDLTDPIGRQYKAFREMGEGVAVATRSLTSSLLISR